MKNGYSTASDYNGVVVSGRHLMTQHEAPTVGTVQAGMVLEETPNGVQPHSTDGVRPDRLLVATAQRGYVHGDAYPEGETIRYMELAGGKVQGLLAAGESVSLSDGLVSAGDGTLRLYDETATAEGGDADTAGDAAFYVPNDEPINKSYAVDNSGGTEAVGVFAEATN